MWHLEISRNIKKKKKNAYMVFKKKKRFELANLFFLLGQVWANKQFINNEGKNTFFLRLVVLQTTYSHQ